MSDLHRRDIERRLKPQQPQPEQQQTFSLRRELRAPEPEPEREPPTDDIERPARP